MTPGVALFGLLLALLPKKFSELRIVLYILIFVLFRDTMTPMHFWEISSKGVIRFSNTPWLLVALGFISGGLVAGIHQLEPELRALLIWVRGSLVRALGLGSLGGLVIAAPAFFYYRTLPQGFSGSSVPASMALPLFLLAMLGNFLEEVLFRGYLQGLLEKKLSHLRAALLSGIFFSAFHSFLAISVTSIGVPVLLFTLYEGLLCAFLRMKYGVISAVMAHGLGIFLLASGWLG